MLLYLFFTEIFGPIHHVNMYIYTSEHTLYTIVVEKLQGNNINPF